jgi:predicted amidohydrolase YtcJ
VIYLLVNAIVRTLDDSLPVAQALAVKDGRIVEVGGSDEILWLREHDYEVIDLEGRVIVPVGTVLAAGNPADFLVLSDDPGDEAPRAYREDSVVETWVDGVRRMVRP